MDHIQASGIFKPQGSFCIALSNPCLILDTRNGLVEGEIP